MLRFVRLDAVHKVRRSNGRPATEVFQMLCEAEKRIGLAKRDIHRHIGDVTLFWSGMYPERLRRLRSEQSIDGYVDYCRQGKRAYAIAAEIEADEFPENFQSSAQPIQFICFAWKVCVNPSA